MPDLSPLRLGLDVSKVAGRDGLGTFVRGVLSGLDEILRSGEEGPVVRLYDPLRLLGDEDPDAILRAELAPLLPDGEPARGFESRLGGSADAAPVAGEIDILVVTGWQIPPGWRGPTLFVVYDLTFLSHPRCHTVDNRIHCLEGVLDALLRDARPLAISSATARELGERFGLEDEVSYVALGVDEVFRPAGEESTRRRLGERFGLEPDYVLAVGSLEPRKNLERLVSAHAALPDELRAAHPLVVAGGGGWRNADLGRALDDAESRGDVHRLGRVSRDDLATLYRGAALFAYPSLAEGFGLPVVEAMACGTAVVTSNVSSLPEAAGDAARLVDPEDDTALRRALEDLLEDDGARAELAAKGLERVRELSWRRTAEEIVELAEELA